jgi:Ni2+-binding GTPase involved in maturation of urease and hydrogenase
MASTAAKEGKIITEDWIIGVTTGGCPHAAIRDPSINLAVIQEVTETHPELDILLLRAGGTILRQRLALRLQITLFCCSCGM